MEQAWDQTFKYCVGENLLLRSGGLDYLRVLICWRSCILISNVLASDEILIAFLV